MNLSQRIKRRQAVMYRNGHLVPYFNSGSWDAAQWCPACDGNGWVYGAYDYEEGKYSRDDCQRCYGHGIVPKTSGALRQRS